jgi:hypothetical protein
MAEWFKAAVLKFGFGHPVVGILFSGDSVLPGYNALDASDAQIATERMSRSAGCCVPIRRDSGLPQ